MLARVDRILVASADAQAAASRWQALVDAQIERVEDVPTLNSRRVVLRLADAELEVHEPLGAGPVADHLARGGGPFAAGMSAHDLPALVTHLQQQGIQGVDLGGGTRPEQLYLDSAALGIPGLRVVLSGYRELAPVGLLESLYECTHLTADARQSTAAIARVFGLDAEQFVAIQSDTYGYEGSLTLYDSSRLHRIETIHPFDASKTMGRFLQRFGPSLYMCYAEAPSLAPLQERMRQLAPQDWTGSEADPNGMFIHPRATGTTMMGVNRRSYAWTWSGYPDRVEPLG